MLDGWEDVDGVVQHQGLSYSPEIIRIELTSHFGIENSRTRCQKRALDLQSLPIPTQLECRQLRLDLCHRWGLIDGFCDGLSYIPIGRTPVTTWAGLPMSTDWKDASYDSLLVVVDWLTKMVHSKPAQMIDSPRLHRLNRQQLRLSLHLQVLVHPVLLSSSTAVSTYTSPAKISIPVLDYLHLFVTFFTCRCWSRTTRKGRVYRNAMQMLQERHAKPRH